VLDLAKKIDTIKDKDTRELIRQRLLTDMAGLASVEVPAPKPLALESSHALKTSFEPPKTRRKVDAIVRPQGKGSKSKQGEKR